MIGFWDDKTLGFQTTALYYLKNPVLESIGGINLHGRQKIEVKTDIASSCWAVLMNNSVLVLGISTIQKHLSLAGIGRLKLKKGVFLGDPRNE